jgi:asparagine synthase (glutamine-hydrolysing)
VPLGIFLSGGVDSSALVGLVSTVARPPTTLSLVFPDRDLSEEPRIRKVVARYGTQHQQIELSDNDALTEVPGAVAAMDQPTLDGVNTYIVSRLARSAGLTVALSGVGGDELFGGYPTFRAEPMLRLARRLLPGVLGGVVGSGLERTLGEQDRVRKAAAWLRREDPELSAYALQREVHSRSAGNTLAPRLAHYRLPEPTAVGRLAQFDAVSLMELSTYMRNTLLRDVDVMGMAHGLEIRVPFLDHEVVELVASVGARLKKRRGVTKPLLVDAVHDLIPAGIATHPKRGFDLPFDTWLRGSLRTDVEETLYGATGSELDAVLDPEATAKLWGSFLTGATSWSRPWSVYVLKRWAARHLVDNTQPSPTQAAS